MDKVIIILLIVIIVVGSMYLMMHKCNECICTTSMPIINTKKLKYGY